MTTTASTTTELMTGTSGPRTTVDATFEYAKQHTTIVTLAQIGKSCTPARVAAFSTRCCTP